MAYRARNSTGPRPPMSLSHSLSLLLCPLSPSPGCRHSWLPSHLFPSCFPSLPIRFVLLPLARISLFPPALPLLSFPLCPCLFLIRRSSNLFAPPPPSSYAAPNRRRVSLLLPSPASQLDSFTASSLSVVRQQLSCLFRVLTFYRFFSSPLCQAIFIHPGLRASQPLPVSSTIYIYISREACLVNLKLIYTDFNISSFFDERSIN